MPVLPSVLTGFYMRATLAFSWLIKCEKLCKKIKSGIILKENVKNFPWKRKIKSNNVIQVDALNDNKTWDKWRKIHCT